MALFVVQALAEPLPDPPVWVGASDAVARALHVSLSRGRTRIEILEYQRLRQIKAPFEEPPADGLEES